MIFKDFSENELYLFMNGKLIYKRWLDTGVSKVFDVMAYDKYTLASIKELTNQYGLLIVKARIKLIPTEQGGRKTGIISGYSPNHVFEYASEGKLQENYIGNINFEGEDLMPGEERITTVRFLLVKELEQYLTKGRKWWLHEGPKLIGEAEIL
ncbi:MULTISPECIES: hypothetical protein [Sphingobacterium]|uniref:hypothetical protein n=1 Tax=Sphingobacterium TaxID=28453 RepID=UPI000958996C|nr:MULTISPECIES: hypothetical protein [Sphingobacterium]APU97138.1 hypothetical protein BV902_12905 [Sphingobacterium sp. B29]QRY56349.1 hypothetical protein JVX97_20335 [Sphingobacterium siyangense]